MDLNSFSSVFIGVYPWFLHFNRGIEIELLGWFRAKKGVCLLTGTP
jgi:hypothetical protein